MGLAMAIGASLCIVIGCYPEILTSRLPSGGQYSPYTPTHIVTQLQLLIFASLAVMVLMRTGLYPPEIRGINIEGEWIFRKGWRGLCRWLFAPIDRFFNFAHGWLLDRLPAYIAREAPLDRFFNKTLGVNWRLSMPVLLAVVFLLIYLLIHLP